MKNIYLLMLVFALVSGCAKGFDKNPRYAVAMEKQYYERDKAACEMISQGLTPPPEMMPVPQPYTMRTTGNINGNYYSQNTTVNNDAAAMNAGMYNLGAAIGARMRRNNNYNECMRYLGWRTEKEFTPEMQSQQDVSNRIYTKLRTLQQDPLYPDVLEYMKGYFNGLPPGEKEVVIRRVTTDVDAFEDAYQKARPKVEAIRSKDSLPGSK